MGNPNYREGDPNYLVGWSGDDPETLERECSLTDLRSIPLLCYRIFCDLLSSQVSDVTMILHLSLSFPFENKCQFIVGYVSFLHYPNLLW